MSILLLKSQVMKFQLFFIVIFLLGILSATQINAQFSYDWGVILTDEYSQRVTSMALDDNDNVYLAGLFLYSIDLDPGPGTTEVNADFRGAFLAKYSKDGELLWAVNLNMATSQQSPNQLPDLDVDGAGNCYIIGQQEEGLVKENIYFAKYSPDGVKIWDYEIVGESGNHDIGWTVSGMTDGSCVVAGFFEGTKDFAPGEEIFELISAGIDDLFLAKYNEDGTLNWAKNFGGATYSQTRIYDLKVDLEGAIYFVGPRHMTFDFDPIDSTTNSIFSGSTKGYVAKYNSDGNFSWVKQWDDHGSEGIAYQIAIDHDNNFIVTGIFSSLIDFDFSQDSSIVYSVDNLDVFVAKYSSQGELFWGIPLRSSGWNYGKSLAVDTNNNIHVTGSFRNGEEGFDLDPSESNAIFYNSGFSDIFYAIYNEDGHYINGFTIGGEDGETSIDIKMDSENSMVMAGWYSSDSLDFDVTDGMDIHSGNGTDVFLIKYSDKDISMHQNELSIDQINLFPNPVHVDEVIHLDGADIHDYQIEILDLKGNLIGRYFNTNEIPCPQKSGIYNLVLSNKNIKQRTIRFVVIE